MIMNNVKVKKISYVDVFKKVGKVIDPKLKTFASLFIKIREVDAKISNLLFTLKKYLDDDEYIETQRSLRSLRSDKDRYEYEQNVIIDNTMDTLKVLSKDKIETCIDRCMCTGQKRDFYSEAAMYINRENEKKLKDIIDSDCEILFNK